MHLKYYVLHVFPQNPQYVVQLDHRMDRIDTLTLIYVDYIANALLDHDYDLNLIKILDFIDELLND